MAARPSLISTVLASIKQEPVQSPTSLSPSDSITLPSLALVKTEAEEAEQMLLLHPPEKQPELEKQPQQREPQFLKSINDLATLSSAIHDFKCKFDELTQHLEFIKQAIGSKLSEQLQQQRTQIETPPPLQLTETQPPLQLTETQHPLQSTETQPPLQSTETDIKAEKGMETPPLNPSRSDIQTLCETMCSKGLRKYIAGNLSNVSKLREEVPPALKLALRPARLVLDCIGRFFLQGIKAYTKDSPMIPARQASVLVLEFFLLMMGRFRGEGELKIAPEIKVEAEGGAVAWRKRLIAEGGLNKASEVDARGLLLFVACFGIPGAFHNEDLGNLLRLCNLRAISEALNSSPVLPAKMPDIIQDMAKKGMYIEAVDVASIFSLEDKLSPKEILTLFLQESTKSYKRARQEAQSSPVALLKANEKQLDALKSVVQYIENHSTDVTKLLGAWQIEEKIDKLEEENAELHKRIEDKKTMPKRKLDEMVSSSQAMSQELKRSRFAAKGSTLQKSSLVSGLHEHQTTTLADGIRSYDGLVPNSLDSAIPSHVCNYPAASSLGSFPENGIGQIVGNGGVGNSNVRMDIGVISTSSYSGAYGDNVGVDNTEQVMTSSGLPYGGRHASGGLFRSLPSVEGFVGLPDLPPSGATDSTKADLYRFADSVVDNESYSSRSQRMGTFPTVEPVHRPSYMY